MVYMVASISNLKVMNQLGAVIAVASPITAAYPTAGGMRLFLMCGRLETTERQIVHPFDLAIPV
jgi:hypothetical protein